MSDEAEMTTGEKLDHTLQAYGRLERRHHEVQRGRDNLREDLITALSWLYGYSSMPECERMAEVMIKRHGITLAELDAACPRVEALCDGSV